LQVQGMDLQVEQPPAFLSQHHTIGGRGQSLRYTLL